MNETAKIIDGKLVSQSLRTQIKIDAENFLQKHSRNIGLAVVLVGDNSASQVYVKNKIKACEETSIKSFAYYLPSETRQSDVIALVESLNDDKKVDGILVQLPLPKHIDERAVLEKIRPEKDVDGFSPVNAGNLMLSNPCLSACTPSGIMEMLKFYNIDPRGKNAVVVGRSNIVGKPIALMLLRADATVTVCHSKTIDLKVHTLNADILVAAIGVKEFITGDMVKTGAVVVDVGMNRADNKLYGDVNFPEVSQKASFITPVPGGVGPMTITCLMQNTVKAANQSCQ